MLPVENLCQWSYSMLKGKWKVLKNDSELTLALVILLISVVMGAVVRIQFVSGTTYPINDGGLFYQMVRDLLGNGLRIPDYTTYNNDQIPFAYPPLAFYLIAIIKLATKQTLLNLFRLVPLIINILVIPAFYLLASRLDSDRIKVALSVLFFALLPRTYQWLLMGGGVTRGLGFLFAVLALISIWDLFSKQKNWKYWAGSILFSAGCVLSHPETSLFLIFMAVLFFVYHHAGWENLKSGAIVAGGVIICVLPWILTIYAHHGWAPFVGAGSTGHGDWLEIKNFITLNFGFEQGMFLQIVSVFALIAVFLKREKLTYFLSASILVGYFLFPRSGPNLLTIQVSVLAAEGFYEILKLSGKTKNREISFASAIESSVKSKLLLVFTIIYLFLGAFSFKYIVEISQLSLTDDLIKVYNWLEENASEEDAIMFYPVLDDDRYWWNDFAAEWFPALTSKSNLTTVQGYEWIEGEYQARVYEYLLLRACSEVGPDCVNDWEARNGIRVNLLVLSQIAERQDFVKSFLHQANYSIAYMVEDYLVLYKE